MSPGERSMDQKLDDLSASMDRVLSIVQDHSAALVRLESGVGALRVDVQQIRVELADLASAFRDHLGWHLRQQPGGPSPRS